jgi:hypothetical protein
MLRSSPSAFPEGISSHWKSFGAIGVEDVASGFFVKLGVT